MLPSGKILWNPTLDYGRGISRLTKSRFSHVPLFSSVSFHSPLSYLDSQIPVPSFSSGTAIARALLGLAHLPRVPSAIGKPQTWTCNVMRASCQEGSGIPSMSLPANCHAWAALPLCMVARPHAGSSLLNGEKKNQSKHYGDLMREIEFSSGGGLMSATRIMPIVCMWSRLGLVDALGSAPSCNEQSSRLTAWGRDAGTSRTRLTRGCTIGC